MSEASSSPLVFAWNQFGPYHMDRCEALGRALAGRRRVIGLELVSQGEVYDWAPSGEGRSFQKLTLFPGERDAQISAWRHFTALLRACLRSGARYIFLCDFQLPAIFLAACLLRLLGRRVIVMQDSKFDDKQRSLWRELGKAVLYRPYNAAFVGGSRSKSYLEFLGMPAEHIVTGYDTVSMERLARLVATDKSTHAARHFAVIARFVPEKNLELALDAYAAYRQRCSGPPRELLLCGAGPLEDDLKHRIAQGGIDGVRFCGWLDEQSVARVLAASLALILPSTEEPFGLVVNEALALGVPVLVAENCGARDLLVRSGVNGYVIEPDNAQGLAVFMQRLARDEAEWQRLSANTKLFRSAADTAAFIAGVEELLQRLERR